MLLYKYYKLYIYTIIEINTIEFMLQYRISMMDQSNVQ